MRRILVDHARRRRARRRRGEGASRAGPASVMARWAAPPEQIDILALDDALNELEQLDPRSSRLVELRFFAGLTLEETAAALGTSLATVKRDWLSARAFLLHQMSGSGRKEHRQRGPAA